MSLGQLGIQIAIKSEHAFDSLKYIDHTSVDSKEWYPSKEKRDRDARTQYFKLRQQPWKRGELYIMNIIDEEIKPDDLRLR